GVVADAIAFVLVAEDQLEGAVPQHKLLAARQDVLVFLRRMVPTLRRVGSLGLRGWSSELRGRSHSCGCQEDEKAHGCCGLQGGHSLLGNGMHGSQPGLPSQASIRLWL